MTDDTLPEIEAPLPTDLLDRLAELKRRDETRGLTNLEQVILVDDLHQFNEAMKPLAEALTEVLNEVTKNIASAMEPMVEAMDGEFDE